MLSRMGTNRDSSEWASPPGYSRENSAAGDGMDDSAAGQNHSDRRGRRPSAPPFPCAAHPAQAAHSSSAHRRRTLCKLAGAGAVRGAPRHCPGGRREARARTCTWFGSARGKARTGKGRATVTPLVRLTRMILQIVNVHRRCGMPPSPWRSSHSIDCGCLG